MTIAQVAVIVAIMAGGCAIYALLDIAAERRRKRILDRIDGR